MKLILLKIKISYKAVGRMFLHHPQYILYALLFAFVGLGILLWTFNIGLLWYGLSEAPFTILERVTFIGGIYGGIFTNFDSIEAIGLIIFAMLFGINIACLVYVLKSQGKIIKNSAKSSAGLLTAIIASGCAACGTSILTPILISLGATSSIALSRSIGVIISYLSIVLILYAVYGLGKVIVNHQALHGV